MFSEKEILRYSRHILLDEIGKSGQEKLKLAKVLVIGAGGLGCPALQYLTAAGVGTIGVIDFDVVELSNLQRQVLFGEASLGQNKALAAKDRLIDLNPLISINAYPEKLGVENALELFEEYDMVLDGTDNFATRYLVNDACVITGKPLVYGAIYRFEGQVSVFNYQNGPTYRCLFPDPPSPGTVPNCSEIGVIGVLPGMIGTMQANEVIKIITGVGEVLSGKLLMMNALTTEFSTIRISRVESAVQEVLENKNKFKETDYEFMCNASSGDIVNGITCSELKKRLLLKEDIQLIDVREISEMPIVEELKGLQVPLGNILENAQQIDRDKPVVVYCRSGIRSGIAINQLSEEFIFTNLLNLEGGVMQWIAEKEKHKENVGGTE